MGYLKIMERVEKKYLIKKENYEEFMRRAGSHLCSDEYGIYTICNIYYDTKDNQLIRTSLDKPVYKEKLRLRSYGTPKENGKVFLEIKKKFKGTVHKRRVSVSLSEAENYMKQGDWVEGADSFDREIDFFIKRYHPEPALYLAYDRIAYCGIEDSSLRITFDANIRSRYTNLSLKDGDQGEILLKNGEYVMEIKVLNAMPLWLCKILSELKIYPVSFSKYGAIYLRDNRKEG